ncbi:MAG: hypothetical protein AB7S56_02290 [Halothiobacillaceae bacterium]
MAQLPDLLQLAFTVQHVVARPEHKQDQPHDIRFKQSLSFAHPGDAPDKIMLEITLHSDETESNNHPYQFRLSCLVVLRLAAPESGEDDPTEKTKGLGAQIAIGAMRDHLATLTARAPWGQLILPLFVPSVHLE